MVPHEFLSFVALNDMRFPHYSTSVRNSFGCLFDHGSPQRSVVCITKQCSISSLSLHFSAFPFIRTNPLLWLRDRGSPQLSLPCFSKQRLISLLLAIVSALAAIHLNSLVDHGSPQPSIMFSSK